MRLLIINCVSDRSEIELYKRLHQAGVQVELFVDPRETKQEELNEFGIPTEELFIQSRFDKRSIRSVKKKLQQSNFDLIYAPASRGISASLFATKDSNVKLVSYRGTLGNLSYFNPAALFAHLNPRINRIICVCEAVKQHLASLGIPSEKLSTVHKGHDPAWYENQNSLTKASLNVEADEFLIGCVANVRPLKGIDVLLRAFARVQNHCKAKLVIVGEMRDEKLPQLCRKLNIQDRVQFLGFRTDATQLIPAFDLSIMPSVRREGFPRAIMESIFQGVPAVVSDVGGLPEAISHEESGLVVPARNSELLADAILRLAQDPTRLQELGQKARELAHEKFGVTLYAEKMLKAFEQTLSDDSPQQGMAQIPKRFYQSISTHS